MKNECQKSFSGAGNFPLGFGGLGPRARVGFKNGCRRRARARGPNARKTVASWNLLTQSGKLPSCAVCICSVFISNDVIEICSVFISNDVIEMDLD